MPDRNAQACQVAEDLRWHADQLWEAAHQEAPLKTQLEHCEAIRTALEAYEAVAVAAARQHGDTWADVAEVAGLTPDSARRRWNSAHRQGALFRHTRRTAQDKQDDQGSDSEGHRRSVPADKPEPRAVARGIYVEARRKTQHRERRPNRLASALSHLQRGSRQTVRALAEAIDVSPSYVSRVLSGERVPSWHVAQALALACGSNPDPLRSLWSEASGFEPLPEWGEDAAMRAFHAAIRGLHLADCSPPAAEICSSAPGLLNREEVEALLAGVDIPDWPTVARVILRLKGRPSQMHPVWKAARRAMHDG
ncbi:helix-turn-helix domain-containing protein [Streptomyces sp. NPDC054933]